eukprot:gene12450-15655_t
MIWPLGDLYKTAKAIHLTKELREIEDKDPSALLTKLVNEKRVLESVGLGHYRFRKPRPEYASHEFVDAHIGFGIPDPSRDADPSRPSRLGQTAVGPSSDTSVCDVGRASSAGALKATLRGRGKYAKCPRERRVAQAGYHFTPNDATGDRVLDVGPPTGPPAGDRGLKGGPKRKGRGSNWQELARLWTIWPLGDLCKTVKAIHLTKELRGIEDKDPSMLLNQLVHKKGVLEMLGEGRYRFCKPRPEYGSREFVEVFGRYSGIPGPSSSTGALSGGPDCGAGAVKAGPSSDDGAQYDDPKWEMGGLNRHALAHVWTIWPLGDLYKTAKAVHLTKELREIEVKKPGNLLQKLVHKKGVLEMLGEGRYKFCQPRPEYGSHEFVKVFGRYSGIRDPSSSTGALGGGPDCGAGDVQAGPSSDDGALGGSPKWEVGGPNGQVMAHLWMIWPLGDLYKSAKAIHMTKELRESKDKTSKHLLAKLVHKKGVLESLGHGHYRFRKPRPEYGSHEFVEVFGRYSGIPGPSSSTVALGGSPDCGAGAVQAVPSSDDGALCAIHLTKELREIEDKDPSTLLKKLVHKKGVLESLGQGHYRFRKPRPEYASHEFVDADIGFGNPDPSRGAGALEAGPNSSDGAQV